MRHRKKVAKLGRKSAQRKALLKSLANALIRHKRIVTTLAKAKALRPFVEPIITRAKEDNLHSRRMVFRKLQNKEAVKELFGTIRPKIMDRPGGYTRVIRMGFRKSDFAEMAMIELVDFNEVYTTKEAPTPTKTRSKTRRGGKKKKSKSTDQGTGATTATGSTKEQPSSSPEVEDTASPTTPTPPEENNNTEAEDNKKEEA